MKIGLISNLYPPHILGGAELVVARVAEALQDRGHEIFVITSSPDNKESVKMRGMIKVYEVNPWNLYTMYHHSHQSSISKPLWHGLDIWNLKSYLSIKNILEDESPDLVHVHNYKGLSMAIFGAAKHWHLPVVFTAHDCSLLCPRANLLRGNGELCQEPSLACNIYSSINRQLINNKVDWFTAPSQFIIDQLKSSGFFTETKTTKIPLGMDLMDVKNEKSYEILDIAYMGSLNRTKGVHVLIRAVKMLKGDNIRLHIFGKGSDEDEFKTMAADDSRIKFYGFVDREEVLEKYDQANITVLPSICIDNSPMMIYESLMSSTPVIGSRIGGIPELIEEGVNGYLFEPGSENELIDILKHLQDNPEALKTLERGAYQSALKYDMETHITSLEEIYLQLTEDH